MVETQLDLVWMHLHPQLGGSYLGAIVSISVHACVLEWIRVGLSLIFTPIHFRDPWRNMAKEVDIMFFSSSTILPLGGVKRGCQEAHARA
jgi:hypothetical protein